MLLELTTAHRPADELGYLLHKRPDRFQTFDLSFGRAHVYYPQVSDERTTAALLLEVDPVAAVRGKGAGGRFLLESYVNDRAYTASSFLSTAIAQVFGTALSGRCKGRETLAQTPLPLTARLEVLPVRGGETLLQQLFEPLGYEVQATRHPLDLQFPEWGDGPYYSVTIRGTKTLAELLTHLYVLVPVFDGEKHYYVGQDELEKLLSKGAGWLASHPEKRLIIRRYLRRHAHLYREALARLVTDDAPDMEEDGLSLRQESLWERPLSLNEQRHAAVTAAVIACGARSIIDLGCGEGRLLRRLIAERGLERIVGLDVSVRALEIAARRLRLNRLPEDRPQRVELLHGSLTYRDDRLSGFDAAAVVEVIEHLDPPRLVAFERVLFEVARPKTIVLTTPNREYNVLWETLPAGEFRHNDHRFEWTRAEFQAWSEQAAARFGYRVRFSSIGPTHEAFGSPTQMGVFERD